MSKNQLMLLFLAIHEHIQPYPAAVRHAVFRGKARELKIRGFRPHQYLCAVLL